VDHPAGYKRVSGPPNDSPELLLLQAGALSRVFLRFIVARMNAEPKISFSVRLERELRVQLERAAEADRRPVTQLIRNVLQDFVADRGAAGRAA
jgi:hypothetical protein